MNNFDRVRMMVDEYVRENGTSTVMDRSQFLDWVHQKYENISSKTNNLYPTDISYNLYNAGLKDFPGPNLCLWWEESSDSFRLVGTNYQGTGPVIQYKGKSNERIVARWDKGVLTWNEEFEPTNSSSRKAYNKTMQKAPYDTERFQFKDELDKEKGVLLLWDTYYNRLVVRKEYTTFNREVFERLKALKIKGIPEIYEIEENNGKLVTLEEYIHGSNLLKLMEQKGVFAESEICEITLKLCAVLSRLHNFNPPLIHRDIKPSNIMMRSNGDIVLIDFNASKEYQEGNNQDTVLYGTQYFAAPEQFGFGQSSNRTDIFSIAATMSFLMTDMPANQFLAPGKLYPVWEKCLKMEPKDRYSSVDELAMDIVRIWKD